MRFWYWLNLALSCKYFIEGTYRWYLELRGDKEERWRSWICYLLMFMFWELANNQH